MQIEKDKLIAVLEFVEDRIELDFLLDSAQLHQLQFQENANDLRWCYFLRLVALINLITLKKY